MCHYLSSNVSLSFTKCVTIFVAISHHLSLLHSESSRTFTILHYGVATVSKIDKIIDLFAEYRLFYRALLQKRPMILSILLTKSTPYLSLLLSESSRTFTTAQICRKHRTSALYLFYILNIINLLESLFGKFSIVLCTHSHLKNSVSLCL